MSSRLWSSKMMSRCKRFSSMRHCCIVPCVVCHWHRYVLLMTCAPHLSSLVLLVFFLIMVWIVRPRVGCVEGVGLCVMLVSVAVLP